VPACLTLSFICPGQHNGAASSFLPFSKQVAALCSTGVLVGQEGKRVGGKGRAHWGWPTAGKPGNRFPRRAFCLGHHGL